MHTIIFHRKDNGGGVVLLPWKKGWDEAAHKKTRSCFHKRVFKLTPKRINYVLRPSPKRKGNYRFHFVTRSGFRHFKSVTLVW